MCDVAAIPIPETRQLAAPHPQSSQQNRGRFNSDTPWNDGGCNRIPTGLEYWARGCHCSRLAACSSIPGFEIRIGGEFSLVGGMKGGIRIPAVLLDVHTIPGMSGSPVFAEYSGLWNPDDPIKRGDHRQFCNWKCSYVLGLLQFQGFGT